MKKLLEILFYSILILTASESFSQVNDEKLGAWYMYLWNTTIKKTPLGFQGDIQYRNWNIAGDLEQLLFRGGLTWQPESYGVKLTLGYANIITGAYGKSSSSVAESRIYQEALIPQNLGSRIFLNHRFRYEQRFVENQDFRTRYRYNLFLNIPLNKQNLSKGALYLALYNEIFINGQRNIGNGNRVQFFDRNRFYGALGYSIKDNLKMQAGLMQQTTDSWRKSQIQLSLHHNF